MFKEEIIGVLEKQTKLRKEEIENLIEIPPDPDLGDYAFPCFVLSKHFKKSPNEIAIKLASEIKPTKNISEIKAAGPYLNFFINKIKLAEQIIEINANFGKNKIGKGKKIAIDFSGPNIGKPMHVGHIRSTVIGDSLIRTYEFLGYSPIGINYLGDIGLHIGKLIVAYELWLDKTALKKDPVNELLRLYVKFCSKEKSLVQEGFDEEMQDNEWAKKAKEALKKLELGDKKTEKIWTEIRQASGKAFDRIYDLLNINFTETTGQSQFSDKGRQIVMNALEKAIAKKEQDGAVYVLLDKDHKKYIQRSNETASYITYDLGAAVERYKKYKFDKMIYVTDFRQSAHFDALFSILKLMGYDFTPKMVHLPFGTVKFGNEIMATREGQIILLEDVLKKTIEKANEEIKKRKTKGDAEKVGVGAVKYIILKNEPASDVQFSWETALNFEGNTGPYLQYSYARASSILKRAGNFNRNNKKAKIKQLTKEETSLIKKISDFPEIVEKAGKQMNPSLIANYSFELAQIFNEFYHNNKVIGDKEEAFRLRLVQAFRTTIKNSLWLLGIEVMEEM
ncbi:MAG: arginine--tRNA ligase [Candidatus Nanoarchaeia archaeon]|nr:arginine--tRNA ligase [Candidatus Nanoarchaeia archaeon]MDD5740581.1 arginine--tRNA ligase [Candidatus Nanoarchaeia archaeon]